MGSQVAADRVDLHSRAAAVSRTRSVPCLGRFQNLQPASHRVGGGGCTASRGHVEGGCPLRWPRAPCRLLRVFSPEPKGRVLMTGLDCSEDGGGPLLRRVTGRPRPPAVHLKPAGWALAPSRRGEAGARAGVRVGPGPACSPPSRGLVAAPPGSRSPSFICFAIGDKETLPLLNAEQIGQFGLFLFPFRSSGIITASYKREANGRYREYRQTFLRRELLNLFRNLLFIFLTAGVL